MKHITERENFMKMINKEKPDFVPHQPSLLQMILPSALGDRAPGCGTGYDWFGVHWTEEPSMPMMPVPTYDAPKVLEDISDWKDVIKWPDLSKIDWESCAKKDVPYKDPSKILIAMMVSGPFERLHDLMGFEEALCALITDPESCNEFFSKLCDFKIEQIKYLKRYYDIDAVHFQDDWGSQKDLFFNPDIWRKIIKPHVKRVIDEAHEIGVYFNMHSCGKIDRIIDDIFEIGPDIIDPAQPINDLETWNKKYAGKVIFMGGIDAQNVIDLPTSTKEDIIGETRKVIDLFCKDGYLIPFPISLSPNAEITLDESFVYGRTFYNNDYEDEIENFINDKK